MAEMYSPPLDAEVQLSYGRALGYAIWGDPEGEAVLLLHGSPSSRLFAPDPVATAASGVRLVTIDRPGYGRSDSLGGRRILDWPAAASVREAVRRGLDGYVSDEVLERRPWGYRLADVMLPISIWHGAQVGYIPPAHAERMASLLTNSRLRVHSDQGHGLLLARWNDILQELTAR